MTKLERLDVKISQSAPGYRLIAMLVAKTHQLATSHEILSLKEACEMMDITPSHFTLLRNGGADITKIGKDKVDSFAEFLDLPSLAIRFLADQITIQDFYNKSGSKPFKLNTTNALDVIANDEVWGALLPTDIYKVSVDMQLYVIRLYEEATGVKLLHEGIDLGNMIDTNHDKLEQA
jgi:hypothetical protein